MWFKGVTTLPATECTLTTIQLTLIMTSSYYNPIMSNYDTHHIISRIIVHCVPLRINRMVALAPPPSLDCHPLGNLA